MKRFFLFFLLIAACCSAENKIVFLISPPRSLSVGFLRMVEARGDFKVFHEPTMQAYHRAHGTDVTEGWFFEDTLRNYDEVKTTILEAAKSSNVFVKDMGFSAQDLILENLEEWKSPNVYFVFLLRAPHDALISFYKKWMKLFPNFVNVAGYHSSYEIFAAIPDKKPLILLSEELAKDPHTQVQRFCDYVGIPFDEKALSWQDLGTTFNGHEAWADCKRGDLVYHWHGDAIRSTHFSPLNRYDVDATGMPTFSEINALDRPFCSALYEKNLRYYNLMKNGAQ